MSSFIATLRTKYKVLSASTITLWHGGNLDYNQEGVAHKKGRWEFGPALYLTTHYDTARKYSKGSRKLYQITISRGTDIKDVNIALPAVMEFVDNYVIRAKSKDIKSRIEKYVKADKVNADIFLNIIINEDAIKSTDTNNLRQFLVSEGVDYSIQDNAFGWNERVIALFNMKKIVSKKIITSKDKVEVYDLPKEFN